MYIFLVASVLWFFLFIDIFFAHYIILSSKPDAATSVLFNPSKQMMNSNIYIKNKTVKTKMFKRISIIISDINDLVDLVPETLPKVSELTTYYVYKLPLLPYIGNSIL